MYRLLLLALWLAWLIRVFVPQLDACRGALAASEDMERCRNLAQLMAELARAIAALQGV